MATYRVSDQARTVLIDIWEYTARRWSIEQAEHINELFLRRFQSLAAQPLQGRARPELSPDCRSVPVQSFLIIYEPAEYGVLILHVVHGRRRLESLIPG